MPEIYITGFHAIEERIVQAKKSDAAGLHIFYSKPGPRVKKILAAAERNGVACSKAEERELDGMLRRHPAALQEHRGIVLRISGGAAKAQNVVDFDSWISAAAEAPEKPLTVVVLDSVTDPHNVGAILRSCDQFGAALVILPERRGANDISNNEVIARSSAGASAWVPVAVATNLVRAVRRLKENGFWIYGADAGGASIERCDFAPRRVLVMGSEGSGISRLLSEQCDAAVSIPTCGKIDSLNVSVAAGVLLYELHRRTL